MITYNKTLEIEKNIRQDIDREFQLIMKEIEFFLSQDFDPYFLKEFIKHYPPKVIKERAEVLLETLINYYMKDIIINIRSLDPEKQYTFLKIDLRESIKRKYLTELDQLISRTVPLSKEKEMSKKLPVLGSVALTTGGITTALIIPEPLMVKLIPGVSSILASILVLKSYKNTVKKFKRKWKKDVNLFINKSKKIIIEWLKSAEKELILNINKLELPILEKQARFV